MSQAYQRNSKNFKLTELLFAFSAQPHKVVSSDGKTLIKTACREYQFEMSNERLEHACVILWGGEGGGGGSSSAERALGFNPLYNLH